MSRNRGGVSHLSVAIHYPLHASWDIQYLYYPRDPFLANNWCVCKCVMWRLSETEHGV